IASGDVLGIHRRHGALAKGIDDWDVQQALEAAVVSSNYHPELISQMPEPRAAQLLPKHLKFIESKGFIPADSVHQSVSYGLECAYYDWCIAALATHVGDAETAERYQKRAAHWQKYFDADIGFMRGKLASGQWREPFDPFFSDLEHSEFVEGNSWQWMWFVPHDVEGYIEQMGGPEAFAEKLDALFGASSKLTGDNAPSDITGLIGQYAHGNEPSHHVAHFYNYVGQPEKAQARLQQIMQQFYLPTPEGIIGNEDCGAMSAWYVLNALGFYQVCPGEAKYSIGRPMVEQATIQLEDGGAFTITVEGQSMQNKRVQSVSLNGEILTTPFFDHSAIKGGGSLHFKMQ
ncbi:MAG: glycoside hydrolase family 92 protein, partial [Bacteroidota bacterium]